MKNNRLNIILGVIVAVLFAVFLYHRTGMKKYTVEDLTGRTSQDILRWIEQNEIPSENVVFNYLYSETVPQDHVISQNLPANSSFSGRNTLVINISSGSDPGTKIELADFSGMDQNTIMAWFEDNRIRNYSFITKIDDFSPEGLFMSSDPQPGTRISRNDPVTVVLCEHDPSPTVALPDFTGQKREDIERWAEVYNIGVAYIYYNNESETDSFLFADVPAGTQIEKGGSISVAISAGNN